MSQILGALGLQPDTGSEPAAPAAPAAPVVAPAAPVAAPAAPAVPQSVTGLVAQPAAPVAPQTAPTPAPAEPVVPEDGIDEVVVPEGAENPDAVKNLIQAERAAARAAYKRARDAEAQLAAITEANMPVEERLAAIEQRAKDAELRATKFAVGMKHGLSATFAEMLQGSNEAELETHAQTVLQELNQRTAPVIPGVTLNGGLNTPPPAAPVDPHRAHAQFLGQLLGRTGA